MRLLSVICIWIQAAVLAGSTSVLSVEKQSATIGDSVTLQCQLMAKHQKVFQVTWQKESGNATGPVATYSRKYGQNILGYSSQRMQLYTVDALNMSTITIHPVTLEDQGCFNCIFNVYPTGANIGRTCLYVYEAQVSEPQMEINTIVVPEMSEELLIASCAATGRPAPNISWNLPEHLEWAPQTYMTWNPDHTVTVISNFTQSVARNFDKSEVTCAVRHPALGSDARLYKLIQYTEEETSADKGNSRLLFLLPISVCVSLLLLCGVIIYKLRKMQRKLQVYFAKTQRTRNLNNSEIRSNGYTACPAVFPMV